MLPNVPDFFLTFESSVNFKFDQNYLPNLNQNNVVPNLNLKNR